MRKILMVTIFVSIIMLLLSLSCTDTEKQTALRETKQKQSAQREYEMQQELNRQAERVEAMRAEAEEMLQGLQEKELLLQIKQSELDSLREHLELKETELALREEAAEKTKRTGQWLLFIGIVLILISLFLFMNRSRRQNDVKQSATSGDLSDQAAAAEALAVKQTKEAETALPTKSTARTRRKPAAKAPQAEGEEKKPTSRQSRKKAEPKATDDKKDAAENKQA